MSIDNNKERTLGYALRKATEAANEMRAKELEAEKEQSLDDLNEQLHNFTNSLEGILTQRLEDIKSRKDCLMNKYWTLDVSRSLNLNEVKYLSGYKELEKKCNELNVKLSEISCEYVARQHKIYIFINY